MRPMNTILVVDDDPINIDIVQETLGECCRVHVAHDGETALAALPQVRPHIVLLDIMMPGIDGYAVCRAIREDRRHAAIKIILLSGRASIQERLEGYAAGADDYIVKPFVDDELLAKVRVYTRLSRTEEVDELKSDLLKLFSHETRTPLNAILGLSEVIKDDSRVPPDVRDLADDIKLSGRRLLEFFRKAQLLFDIKKGADWELQEDSFGDRALAWADDLHQTLQAGRIELDVTGDPTLMANWDLLAEVFRALVENVWKFADRSTTAEVTVRGDADSVVLEVADRGPGVNAGKHEEIFEPFTVQDIAHHGQGQGLSLAIAREIALLHGGDLTVRDRPGGGAIFRLVLPTRLEAGAETLTATRTR